MNKSLNNIMNPFRFVRDIIRDYPWGPINPTRYSLVTGFDGNFKIPLHCVQTWQENSFGRTHRQSLQQFQNKNKTFQFDIMFESDRDKYMRESWGGEKIYNIYKNAKFKVMAADIFRYCYIYEKGGFYTDIAKRPPEALLSYFSSNPSLILFKEASGAAWNTFPIDKNAMSIYGAEDSLIPLYNTFFAATAGHRFLRILINNIIAQWPMYCDVIFANPRMAIISLTGPGMFLKSFFEYCSEKGDITDVSLIPIKDAKSIYFEGSEARYKKYPSYMDFHNEKLSL